MQAEATIIERVASAYVARRGVRLICVLAVLSAVLFLFLLAGGFPPGAWRLLVQALMQAPALLAARGQIVLVALAGQLLISISVLLAYWALFWLAWRMLAFWWYERQELRNFAVDVAEAQYQAEEDESGAYPTTPASTNTSYGAYEDEDEDEEAESKDPYHFPLASRSTITRRHYPFTPLSLAGQDDARWFEDEMNQEDQSETGIDSDKDVDFSRVPSQFLRPAKLAGATAFEPQIVEHSGVKSGTDNLNHSSYGRFMPFSTTATAGPAPRLNTILYDYGLAPSAPRPMTTPDPSVLRSAMQLVVGTGLDVGLKRKGQPNEDSLLALQNTRLIQGNACPVGLFVIADGMGGHENGQEASRMVIQSLSKTIVPSIIYGPTDDNHAELLAEGVHQANLAIYQRNHQENGDMGTTIAAALVVNSTVYVANVGDSRVYLYRAASGLSQITRDHSTVARLVENGVIEPEDIYTHPRRNEIYRSLGRHPSEDIDRFTLALQAEDLLLLCSDGLWEMVRDSQIKQIIKTNLSQPTQLSAALIQAALEGGGKDNISVIAVYIKPAELIV